MNNDFSLKEISLVKILLGIEELKNKLRVLKIKRPYQT